MDSPEISTGRRLADMDDDRDLEDLWADEAALRVPRRDDEASDEQQEFDDDMQGFIEADDDEGDDDMGEAERQERLERKRAEKERRRIAGGLPKLEGLDQE